MQRFFYYEQNKTKKVIEILEKLLTHYPKKVYWQHLSAMHGDLKDESKQLAAMETAYVQGMLEKDKEVLNMAYMLLSSDVPYKAALVLDKGIRDEVVEPTSKNLEVLGNAWRQSQEIKKAIPRMAEAAKKSDKGELWTRLCNVYLDGDQYKEAVDSCKNGLKKGGVKRPDTANLILGMAHFNLKQYKSARAAFKIAAKDKRSAKYAKQWMNFMAKELERQKSLRDS
jgi:tetratricopeptide (TPR) repeat protein